MAEPGDAHVVEIPDGARPHTFPSTSIEHHPLTQIAESPGHLLLLKLWQREEHRLARRICFKESLLDDLRREAFHLAALFFAFHGLSLTLLFTASVREPNHGHRRACKDWWLPSGLSFLTSLALVFAVQAKLHAYWRANARLLRERGDARALARCVQDVRMKGSSFDLSRETLTQGPRRVKSSSVEVRWRWPLRWCLRNLVTLCLLCFTALMFPASKFILCG